MALFSFKSKPKIRGEGCISDTLEVLAYLDEIVKRKLAVTISTATRDISGQIFFLEEKDNLMRVQAEGLATFLKGKKVQVGFSLDRSWFTFSTTVHVKDGKAYLGLPCEIRHNERRKSPRTSFSAREQVKITILEGLGSGNGVFGNAIDVSRSGICLNIDKAMVLSSQKEISPGPALYKQGCPLMLIKINKIPGCPPFECEGKVLRVFKDGKWKIAVELKKMPSIHMSQIEKFIQSRSIPFKLIRRKRSKDDTSATTSRDEPLSRHSPEKKPGLAIETPSNQKTAPDKPETPSHRVSGSQSPETEPLLPESGKTKSEVPPPEHHSESAPLASVKKNAVLPIERAPVQIPDSQKPVIFTFGRDLIPFLLFLKKRTQWNAENQIQNLIKKLNTHRPRAIFFSETSAGSGTLELIQKLTATGLLKGVEIYWAHMTPLNSKTHVKLRMAGIERTLKIPVEDKKTLIERLQQPLPEKG
jgi:hypothetical protein